VVTGKDNSDAELVNSQSVWKFSIPQQVSCSSVRLFLGAQGCYRWREDGVCFLPPVLFKHIVSYMFS